MRYAFAPLAFGLGANALVARDAPTCVQLKASGGVSGILGQLSDGQNRVGGGHPTGCYCLSNGGFTDSRGSGCILTPPTKQFQCDAGATAQTGFSIGSGGSVTYNGNSKFYACPVNDNGEYNVYSQPAPGQKKCVEISLSSAGSCGAASSSGKMSSPPAQSTMPAQQPSPPVQSVKPSPQPSPPAYQPSKPVSQPPQPSTLMYQPSPPPQASQPKPSKPAPSQPAQPSMPAQPSQPGYQPSPPSQPSQPVPSGSAPKPSGQAPMPSAPAPAPSQPAPKPSAPAPQPSAPMPSQSAPQPSSSAGSCPTDLNGNYQYPHLIVPVNSATPNQAYGTSYFGAVNSTTCTIFNFDIPASYSGKTCTVLFLFPEKKDLETSSFTTSGQGNVQFTKLNSAANQQTCYAKQPAKGAPLVDMAVMPGNKYVVASGTCAAGQTVSYEMCSQGSYALNYFQDYNPSPIGLYVRQC